MDKLEELRLPMAQVDAYRYFLPQHPHFHLLQEAPNAKLPTALSIWKKMLNVQENHEKSLIQKEVQARRYRLGAPPLPVVQREVEAEVLADSKLDEAYCNVIQLEEDPRNASAVMLKRFDYLQTRLRILPADLKVETLQTLMQLARCIVFESKLDDQDVMECLLNLQDVDTLDDYDPKLIQRLIAAFPDHSVSVCFHALQNDNRVEQDTTEVLDKVEVSCSWFIIKG